MRPILLLDVNETLLDLSSLDDHFQDVLGNATLRPAWFAQMLQLSFVGGLTGDYVSFSEAQRAALCMVAARIGKDVTETETDRIVGAMNSLPPHPEVKASLLRLKAAGFRLATLTNSVLEVATEQAVNAGFADLLDAILTADSVRALKPAAPPYEMAAKHFGTPVGATCLVAAHSWDITGALSAGCLAAFVQRPGAVLSPLGPQPTISGPNLAVIADRLIADYAE